jgi:hypothetical protein
MSELPVPAVAPVTLDIQRMASRAPGAGVGIAPVGAAQTPARPDGASTPTSLADVAPLFGFMRDAERRFDTLRMTILDRQAEARGVTVTRSDVWGRHPGSSRVEVGDPDGQTRAGRHAWVINGDTVTHLDADANVVRSRPHLPIPHGADSDGDLPSFGRVYRPMTPLPAGTLADTFVHPHGFCRNVLATGRLSLAGIATGAAGREMTLVRCDHPRSAKVLVDRPDRWLLVGVDRATGLVLLLEEHVGDEMTRRAEVTSIQLDEPMGDEVFTLHVSGGVRRLY